MKALLILGICAGSIPAFAAPKEKAARKPSSLIFRKSSEEEVKKTAIAIAVAYSEGESGTVVEIKKHMMSFDVMVEVKNASVYEQPGTCRFEVKFGPENAAVRLDKCE